MHTYAQAPKQQPVQITGFAPPGPLAEGSDLRPALSQRQLHPCAPVASFDVNRIPAHSPVTPVIQMKLTVNAPGDAYEREADRMAEDVSQMPESGVQRACAGGCSGPPNDGSDEDRKRMQTKRLGSSGDGGQVIAPLSVQMTLRSPGQPLDTQTRAFVEPRFGFDFSQVRIHTDGEAAQSARDVNAHAYTVGRDVVFAAGRFAPGTPQGQRLLAHELTHVVQQGHSNPSVLHVQRQTPKNAPDTDAGRDRAAHVQPASSLVQPQGVTSPSGRRENAILSLQRTVGNRDVQRLVIREPSHASKQPARIYRMAQEGKMLQRAPADPSSDVANARKALEEATSIASDLLEETTGRTTNIGRGGGRKARAIRRRTQKILAELEGIANHPNLPEAQRDAATRLHGQIEDLSNEARAAEIERARAAGASKTAKRARGRVEGATGSEGTRVVSETRVSSSESRVVEMKGPPAPVSVPAKAGKVETAAANVAATEAKAAATEVKAAATEIKAVTTGSRIGSGIAKLGAMGFHLLLPGPLDALMLMVQFAGSYAEAREAIRSRNTRTGFAIGLAAGLMGRSHRAVRKHLSRRFVLDREVHTQVIGAVGVAERAHNAGLDAGFRYAGTLSDEAKDALREFGFSSLAKQGRLPEREVLFAAEGVWRLAAALLPAVDQIFEAMRVEAEKQMEEEMRRMKRESGCVGMKC